MCGSIEAPADERVGKPIGAAYNWEHGTTDKTLERVRVEVHLSNGKELGPTTPGDLEPGKKRDVKLTPESKDFDGWTAHPEVGSGEHGHGEHDRGEHDRKGGEQEG